MNPSKTSGQAGPPDPEKLFGSTFIWLGLALAVVVVGYIAYKQIARPELQVVGVHGITLNRHLDGHYHLQGSLNGSPVTFLVDTGASMASVSAELAERAGLRCSQSADFHTANGTVRGCIARNVEIAFGDYQVSGVSVAVMPNLDGQPLLGMNVLGRFALEQSNGRLLISHNPAE